MAHQKISRLILVGVACAYGVGCACDVSASESWTDLFNGRNLNGWHATVGNRDAAKGSTSKATADQIFRVVEIDGEPVIRVSGELTAGLATVESFENYHLELEFKWGEERHFPRADLPRDSGLLYHGQETTQEGSGWLESMEFGLLDGGETSDFYSVPGAFGRRLMADMEGETIPLDCRRYRSQKYRYCPGGRTYVVGPDSAALNSYDNDKLRGGWNKLDLFCVGRTAVHVVNGEVNLSLSDIRRLIEGREEPVSRGRIQIQSEGAETYFRHIRLRPITKIPAEYREQRRRPPYNTLTKSEWTEGWQLLFDGETTKGWQGYRGSKLSKGWKVIDGALVCVAEGPDLITRERFDNFELTFDFKVDHGANSGVFYRAPVNAKAIATAAPEYEIRDQSAWLDDTWKTASVYGVYDYDGSASKSVGYWNRARVVVRDNHVEHWLNGFKVADYELGSSDWSDRKNRKFGSQSDYGTASEGYVVIQNHNSHVSFRNIKIKQVGSK